MTTMKIVLTSLLLILQTYAVETQAIFKNVKRIVAVGDIHGDQKQFLKVLITAKIIDKEQNWIGGKTHLVQTGDVFDRAPETRQALDLLMKLEKQAASAGGKVHALIGNHEAMALTGDYRYMTKDEMKSFGGQQGLEKLLANEGYYGKWLKERNAIIQLNNLLFLHGGLHEKFAAKDLQQLNELYRQALKTNDRKFLHTDESLFWYRALARNNKEVIDRVSAIVKKVHGVDRIIIGHTINGRKLYLNQNGKIVCIDVGMSRAYGGPAQGLLIDNGQYFRINGDTNKIEKLSLRDVAQ
ncbi:MAG: metallophosphoesterase, partial [Lentisphaeraceae bacterium]|nr:metallophosphoesterase [Lentisphaeraceae bacterium]